MEIKKELDKYGIIGVVSNYQINLDKTLKVSELNIKNIEKALIMVGLNNSYLERTIEDLSISELFKIDLITKLDKNIIIVGNLYNSLIYKDREYIKKLLLKLHNDYNKKIIVIDNFIDSFINLVNNIYVIKDRKIVYNTNDFYDDELYNYVKMPKIVEFIKYVNIDTKKIEKTIDIYELIKDMYRNLS